MSVVKSCYIGNMFLSLNSIYSFSNMTQRQYKPSEITNLFENIRNRQTIPRYIAQNRPCHSCFPKISYVFILKNEAQRFYQQIQKTVERTPHDVKVVIISDNSWKFMSITLAPLATNLISCLKTKRKSQKTCQPPLAGFAKTCQPPLASLRQERHNTLIMRRKCPIQLHFCHLAGFCVFRFSVHRKIMGCADNRQQTSHFQGRNHAKVFLPAGRKIFRPLQKGYRIVTNHTDKASYYNRAAQKTCQPPKM